MNPYILYQVKTLNLSIVNKLRLPIIIKTIYNRYSIDTRKALILPVIIKTRYPRSYMLPVKSMFVQLIPWDLLLFIAITIIVYLRLSILLLFIQ